jgi:hypothetical protein
LASYDPLVARDVITMGEVAELGAEMWRSCWRHGSHDFLPQPIGRVSGLSVLVF